MLHQIQQEIGQLLFDATPEEDNFPDTFGSLVLPKDQDTLRRSSRLSVSAAVSGASEEHSYSPTVQEGESASINQEHDEQTDNLEDDTQTDTLVNHTCLNEKEAFQLYMLDNELSDKNSVKWKRGTFLTTEVEWYSQAPNNVTDVSTPLEYFSKYFTDNLFNLMVEQTNLFGVHDNPNFTTTNIYEIKQLIGIMIMMGNLGFPRLRLYWDPLFRISCIADNMQLNRFFKLRQTLHVTSRDKPQNAGTDRLWKVRPIYDYIRARCLQLGIESDLCIDEQMIPFKGQICVKQYVANKPTPWGVKVFVLCGKSGIVLDFIIYQGATTEYDYWCSKFGLGAGTVMQLSHRINVPNCRLFFDNYFTSFHLMEWLHRRNIFAVGTARVDRFMKPHLKNDKEMKNEPRGSYEEMISNEGKVVLTKWYDNKGVVVASNFIAAGNVQNCKRWDKHRKQFIDVPRPEAIKLYNESMGGVDKLDFLISLYRIFIRARKWTLRMIDHSIDLAITNSWLEYMRDAKALNLPKKNTLDLIHFRQHVAQALIFSNQSRQKKRGRPSTEDSPVPSPCTSRPRLHTEQRPIDDVRRDRVDHLPGFDDSKDGQRCKNGKCQMKTHFYCEKCNVHLCITKKRNCFKAFHN